MATVFNDANEKIGQRFKYNNKYYYVYDIELDGNSLVTDAPSGAFAFSKDGISEGKIYTVNSGFWVEYSGGGGNGEGGISEDDFINLITSLDEVGTLDPSAQFLALQNDIVVDGIGRFTFRAMSNGKRLFCLDGEDTATDINAISWVLGDAALWVIWDGSGDPASLYSSTDDTELPSQATFIVAEFDIGTLPIPDVTAVPSLKKALPWQIVNRGSVSHTDTENPLTVTNEDCGKIFDNDGAGDPVTFVLDDDNFDDGWVATFQIVADNTVNINRDGTHNIYGQFVFWTGVIADLRELNTCCIASGSLAASITLRKSGGKLNIIAVTGNWFDND